MTARPSWEAIANRLAARLVDAVCDDHRARDADCPFCSDVAAWEAWADRAGVVRAARGQGVPVDQVLHRPEMRTP